MAHKVITSSGNHWIAGAVKKPGSFTRQAKAHGQTVAGYAATVTKPGSRASTLTKRRARLAQTFEKMAK